MITQTTVQKRSFNLTHISEKEGVVLRTLLNLTEIGVRDTLLGDNLRWDTKLSLDDATRIGVELCDKITDMVDGTE